MYLYRIRYRNERFLETIINETILFFFVASKVAFFLDPFSFIYIINARIYIGHSFSSLALKMAFFLVYIILDARIYIG